MTAAPLPPPPSRRRVAILILLFNYSGTLLTIINSLVLVPLYFRFFSMAAFGAWNGCVNVTTWLSVLELGFSLIFVQQLSVAMSADNPGLVARVAGAGLGITAVSIVATIAAGLALAPWIPTWVNAEAVDAPALKLGFVMGVLGAGATMGQTGFVAICQAWQRVRVAGIASVLSLVAGIVATIVGLYSGLGVAALGLGALARGVVGLVIVGTYVLVRFRVVVGDRLRFSSSETVRLIRMTAPVGASRAALIVAQNSEAAVTSVAFNPALAGAIVLTGRVFEVAKLLLMPIGVSVFSGLTQVHSRDGAERTRAVTGELFGLTAIVAAAIIAPGIALNESFVHLWTRQNAYAGNVVSAALGVTAFLVVQSNILGLVVTAIGEVKKTAWLGVLEAVLRLGLLFALPRFIGLVGIPIAAAIPVIITGWAMTQILTRALKGPSVIPQVLRGAPVVLLLSALAYVYALFGPQLTTWSRFIVVAAIIGTVLWGAILALDKPARELLTRRLLRRRAPAP